MPLPISQHIDVESRLKPIPHHPCDPPLPCDPFKAPDGSCLEPYVCLDKVKNPALPHEITRCQPGEFMNAKTCAKIEPPFPCDPPPPCIVGQLIKKPCNEPMLYLERVKNPAPKKKDNCDEVHEPYPPVTNYPFGF